jgi:serine/threonine protein phosphatase PrpC
LCSQDQNVYNAIVNRIQEEKVLHPDKTRLLDAKQKVLLVQNKQRLSYLTCCLETNFFPKPADSFYNQFSFNPGDVILLCTDGVYNYSNLDA